MTHKDNENKPISTDQSLDQPPVQDEKLSGQVLDGRFEIHEVIGRGGMGTVYKARHLVLDQTVAVKVLHSSKATDPRNIKRFQQEAKAISRLSHPNIIQVLAFGIHLGLPYLVMEYLDGESLSTKLAREKRLESASALPIFVQVCEALEHAHNQGVVHRDLKPGNIVLCPNGQVKVVDFGIAKLLPGQNETAELVTVSENMLGSPAYMSPEQCRGKGFDARSDIYALGCVIYQSITGQTPFSANSAMEVMSKHISEKPKTFKQIDRSLKFPGAIEAVTLHAMKKDAADRYQNASAMKGDLLAIQENDQIDLFFDGAGNRKRIAPALLPGFKLIAIPLVVLTLLIAAASTYVSMLYDDDHPELLNQRLILQKTLREHNFSLEPWLPSTAVATAKTYERLAELAPIHMRDSTERARAAKMITMLLSECRALAKSASSMEAIGIADLIAGGAGRAENIHWAQMFINEAINTLEPFHVKQKQLAPDVADRWKSVYLKVLALQSKNQEAAALSDKKLIGDCVLLSQDAGVRYLELDMPAEAKPNLQRVLRYLPDQTVADKKQFLETLVALDVICAQEGSYAEHAQTLLEDLKRYEIRFGAKNFYRQFLLADIGSNVLRVDPLRARKYLLQAIAEAGPDGPQAIVPLVNLADSYANDADPVLRKKPVPTIEQAARIAAKAGQPQNVNLISGYFIAARSCLDPINNKAKLAKNYIERGIPLVMTLPNIKDKSFWLSQYGSIEISYDRDKAIAWFAQADEIDKSLSPAPAPATQLEKNSFVQARSFAKIGDVEHACQKWLEAASCSLAENKWQPSLAQGVSEYGNKLILSHDSTKTKLAKHMLESICEAIRMRKLKVDPSLSQILGVAGEAHAADLQYDKMHADFSDAIALLDAQKPDLGSAWLHHRLADSLLLQGKKVEARDSYRQAIQMYETLKGPDAPDMVPSLRNLSELFIQDQDFQSAENLLVRALDIDRKAQRVETSEFVRTLESYEAALRKEGKLDEARLANQESQALRTKLSQQKLQ